MIVKWYSRWNKMSKRNNRRHKIKQYKKIYKEVNIFMENNVFNNINIIKKELNKNKKIQQINKFRSNRTIESPVEMLHRSIGQIKGQIHKNKVTLMKTQINDLKKSVSNK